MAELVARKYAKAIFESAEEEGALDQVIEEFERFMPMFGEARRVLLSSTIATGEKKSLVEAMQLEGLFHSFVYLLLDKERISLIPDIYRDFRGMVEEKKRIARALVESAVPLDDAQKKALQSSLEKSTGKTVILESRVVPEMIGGVVVRIGDKVLDGSIKSKLEDMLESIREIK